MSSPIVAVEQADLNSRARIRNAALLLFAERGVAATSIRDIATTAGVSPGLVQHHFKTKDAIRRAVNEHIVRTITESFGQTGEGGGIDWVLAVSERVTGLIAEHHLALRYVARAIVDGEPEALAVFDRFVELADNHAQRMADEGLIAEGVDLRWAVLQMLMMNLGLILLAPAVDRQLPGPVFNEQQLRHYHEAAIRLFLRGVFRPT